MSSKLSLSKINLLNMILVIIFFCIFFVISIYKYDEQINSNMFFLLLFIVMSLSITILINKKIKNIELHQKEQFYLLLQYKNILDKSSLVTKTNTDGVITYVNDKFCKISGYSKDELIGKSHNIIKNPQTPKLYFKQLWESIQKGEVFKGVVKNRAKDGSSFYLSTTILPIKNSNNKIIEYISASANVTEMLENREKIQLIFKTDSLTGLGSRLNLIETIDKNKNKDSILALIDIDRFKEINDVYGHKVGDEILIELSNRLLNHFGKHKYELFRVNADIFGVYTTSHTKAEIILNIKEFFEKYNKKSLEINNKRFILTHSCGFANVGGELLAYADIALSEGKKKNIRINEYSSNSTQFEKYKNNITWVNRISEALDKRNFVPYFQPIYSYDLEKITKYECLMRMKEDDEIISAFEFLQVAKKTKYYSQISKIIIKSSIDYFSKTTYEFSVNLCIEDLINKNFMIEILNYAKDKNVIDRLVLEIVESEEMENYEEVLKRIKEFKEAGAKIAIDDFGAGYSNYEYLVSLQADYIKIDGSIIKHICEDLRAADVVKTIVDFAKKSDIKTIAEFISNKEINEKAKELGVDFAQGYYYGKPEASLI